MSALRMKRIHKHSLIIVSDLDGTLLDHHTYSFDAARPALDKIRELGVPLILATSKTAAEIEQVSRALDISHPAIVENGSGLHVPNGYFDGDVLATARRDITPRYNDVIDLLKVIEEPLRGRFKGFSQMSLAEIRQRTGLCEEDARRAKQRQWSEPGIWTGTHSEHQQWVREVRRRGLMVAQGGRFTTVSFGGNKADGLKTVLALYRASQPAIAKPETEFTTIALGDAPNDIEMLAAADVAVIIKGVKYDQMNDLEQLARGEVWRPEVAGPEGWNSAVNRALDAFASNDAS